MRGELVLTRSKAETVVIETAEGPVLIRVKSVGPDRVRLGIVAPPVCVVMRGELDRGGGERFDEVFR